MPFTDEMTLPAQRVGEYNNNAPYSLYNFLHAGRFRADHPKAS
jgi:hypothetical protein